MRATGSTSAQWGPDDPADGLHPVLHVTLGAGHEQERLRVGRHLLLLPGTTCKTGRHRLTAGIPVGMHQDAPIPAPAPKAGLASSFMGWVEAGSPKSFSSSPAFGSSLLHSLLTSPVGLCSPLGFLFPFLVFVIFPYQNTHH